MSQVVIREIARSHRTLASWARYMGISYSACLARWRREGLNAGAIHRAERVRLTLEYAREHGCPESRAALACGWSSAQTFSRAKLRMAA